MNLIKDIITSSQTVFSNKRYALMNYNYTLNLGNEIQSIATRRFLPKIDCYIDHDKLNKYDGEKVNMVMNGWFFDYPNSWPPSNNINALLISMHFNILFPGNKEALLSEDSINYLNEFGPVGCRDLSTLKILQDNDINSYFSGCLTLTLDSSEKNDSDFKYIVINADSYKDIYNFLKHNTNQKIYTINQESIPALNDDLVFSTDVWFSNIENYFSTDEKFFIAENLLSLYENANCVITDRLHCALPCLALNTPVLLLNDRPEPERFEGYEDLLHISTLEKYLKYPNIFDVDNPPENPKGYLKLRKELIKSTTKFTGYMNQSYRNYDNKMDILYKNMELFSKITLDTRKIIQKMIKMNNYSVKYNTARIDIKNVGNENNSLDFDVLDDYNLNISNPDWLSDKEGNGFTLKSYRGYLNLNLTPINDGILKIWLRSLDLTDDKGNRTDICIEYEDLIINGDRKINNNQVTTHNNPFYFSMPVKDSEKIKICIKWKPYDNYFIN